MNAAGLVWLIGSVNHVSIRSAHSAAPARVREVLNLRDCWWESKGDRQLLMWFEEGVKPDRFAEGRCSGVGLQQCFAV